MLHWSLPIFAQVIPHAQDKPIGFIPVKYQNAHLSPESIDSTKRIAWIEHSIDSLLRNFSNIDLKKVEIYQRQREEQLYLTCRIINAGYITAGIDTCYLFLFSSHQNPAVGDVIIAISDKRKVYVNNGHVCGGIVHFQSFKISKPSSFQEFIAHFSPEISPSIWRQYR